MLPNELLLANIGFDTAENEPSRFWVPASVLVTKNIKKYLQLLMYSQPTVAGNN